MLRRTEHCSVSVDTEVVVKVVAKALVDKPKEVSCVVVFTVTDLMGSIVVGPLRGSAHRCIVTPLPACPACC